MTLKDQWKTIKDNWLLVLVVLVVIGFFSLGGGSFGGMNYAQSIGYGGYAEESMDMGYAPKMMVSSYMPRSGGDFAPEVEERKITKTTWLTTEVDRGTFSESEEQLRAIIKSSDSFILNENVNKYDTERRDYYRGSYSIRVESDKYDSVITQLKKIGDIEEFRENANDITGSYTNIEVELEVERDRLKRYQEMYEEAEDIKDKINLNDRIFNQERTIKYYEDRLTSMDTRVDYSTIQFTMTEKQSEYIDAIFVKFSRLITSFVGSINSLLVLFFVVIPYAVAVGLIALIVKLVRRKKRR